METVMSTHSTTPANLRYLCRRAMTITLPLRARWKGGGSHGIEERFGEWANTTEGTQLHYTSGPLKIQQAIDQLEDVLWGLLQASKGSW